MEGLSDMELPDYAQFLPPLTDRVFEFKSRRVEFRRRHSHRNRQLLIIHFEGVVGDIA